MKEKSYGWTYENAAIFLLFGKAKMNQFDLQKYSKSELFYVKQVHSNLIVPASDEMKTADAHYTKEKHKALIIQTADCLPVFFYSCKEHKILACHAGWRGLENKIIEKSVKHFSDPEHVKVWIGPHIFQDSYEVGEEFLETFSAYPQAFSQNNKTFFSQIIVAMAQLQSCGIKQVEILRQNTFSNTELASYRRSKTKVRNYHLIVLK